MQTTQMSFSMMLFSVFSKLWFVQFIHLYFKTVCHLSVIVITS